MTKIHAGIAGAGGYTAGELIRLLVNHPYVSSISCQSNSQAGKEVAEIHQDLAGEYREKFVESLNYRELDVIFLCKGHGKSREFLEAENLPDELKIIDLSQDYRLRSAGNSFVYGLPEVNAAAIKEAGKIANPGCFATCIQLGLLPAFQAGLVEGNVHISGITGSTGAGQSLSATSHFSWRNNNMSVYKAFNHQHLHEIKETLSQVAGQGIQSSLNFVPYRGNFTRGIITTSYFSSGRTIEEAREIYEHFYAEAPFTHTVNSNPHLKQVTNTNKALVYLEKHGDQLMVISMIDNLLKGASGQAVENMNLLLNLDQATGLKLKGNAF